MYSRERTAGCTKMWHTTGRSGWLGEARGGEGEGGEGARLAPGAWSRCPVQPWLRRETHPEEESVFILLGFRVRYDDK